MVTVALVAVAGALAVAGSPTTAAAAPLTRVTAAATARPFIVFSRLDDDRGDHDYEIWTMGRWGGSQRRLTFNDVADHDAAWSPDGARIAWSHYDTQYNGEDSDVWVMAADGSDKQLLVRSAQHPTWSPDGTRLAFTRGYHLWVVNADGTGQHRISREAAFDFDPDWSPDGTRIAFVSQGRRYFDLWTMSPDGSDRRRLAITPVDEHDPKWSPDGRRIAFSESRGPAGWNVGTMRSDGSRPHVVVQPYSLDPAWSPFGNWLVFYACADGPCDLHRSDLAGDGLRRISRRPPPASSDIQPDVRPPAEAAAG